MAAGLRLLLLGAFGAALVLGQQSGRLDVKPAEVPDQADLAAALITQHDCSVTGYDADFIPGHAVVDTGTGPRYAPSGIGFKIAFEGHPGTVYAFCP